MYNGMGAAPQRQRALNVHNVESIPAVQERKDEPFQPWAFGGEKTKVKVGWQFLRPPWTSAGYVDEILIIQIYLRKRADDVAHNSLHAAFLFSHDVGVNSNSHVNNPYLRPRWSERVTDPSRVSGGIFYSSIGSCSGSANAARLSHRNRIRPVCTLKGINCEQKLLQTMRRETLCT